MQPYMITCFYCIKMPHFSQISQFSWHISAYLSLVSDNCTCGLPIFNLPCRLAVLDYYDTDKFEPWTPMGAVESV